MTSRDTVGATGGAERVHPVAAGRRAVLEVPARKASPAPGMIVDRPLPAPEIDYLSPFLLIDHFGPERIAPGSEGGLNPHPHRGFETVTLIYEGAMEHRDSSGGRGVIRPGGVQWMTAARGIVHAEYREAEFARLGGTLHGLQLWINLPRRHKMADPGYQDIPEAQIPVLERDGARLRVIAGETRGLRGPARTFTPVLVADGEFAAEGRAVFEVPAGHHALLYVIEGGPVTTGGIVLGARAMAVYAAGGGDIEVEAARPARVLLLAGEPIDEPVASWGPFVMNTREEIVQAQRDYGRGLMGRLEGVPF